MSKATFHVHLWDLCERLVHVIFGICEVALVREV